MKTEKRVLSLFLAFVMAICLMVPLANAAFSDVPSDAWYAGDVNDVQQYGILKGVGNNKFNPSGNMTLAEAITLTARTYAYSHGETVPVQTQSPWYSDYVNYADAKGLCPKGEYGTDYDKACNRLTMAKLFAQVVTEEQTLNNVTELPDVQNSDNNKRVFYLYNQGVLTGNDKYGTFNPYSNITRAEAAAILNRVLNTSKRKSFSLTTLPEIYGVYNLVSTKLNGQESGPVEYPSWLELKRDGTADISMEWQDEVETNNYTINGRSIRIADEDGAWVGSISPNLIVIHYEVNSEYGVYQGDYSELANRTFAKKGSTEESTLRIKAQAEYDALIAEEKAAREADPWDGLLFETMMQTQSYFAGQIRLAIQEGYNLGELGYLFNDIDEDGIPELLVGFTQDVDNTIRAIYTPKDGHVVCLAVADMQTEELGPYSGLELGGNSTIVKWTGEYNASFETYYRLSKGELKLIESIVALYGGEESYWYSTTSAIQNGEDFYGAQSGYSQISKAHYDNIQRKYSQYKYQFRTDWFG